jgi:hypothetical protein
LRPSRSDIRRFLVVFLPRARPYKFNAYASYFRSCRLVRFCFDRAQLRMQIWSGGLRHFVAPPRRSVLIAHYPQHVLQRCLTTCLGSFHQSARSSVARAFWSAASVAADARLERATSLFFRIVYSVHQLNLSRTFCLENEMLLISLFVKSDAA